VSVHLPSFTTGTSLYIRGIASYERNDIESKAPRSAPAVQGHIGRYPEQSWLAVFCTAPSPHFLFTVIPVVNGALRLELLYDDAQFLLAVQTKAKNRRRHGKSYHKLRLGRTSTYKHNDKVPGLVLGQISSLELRGMRSVSAATL
jgi:hypothetical protein